MSGVSPGIPDSASTLAALRRLLLIVTFVGFGGTLAELWLMRHDESASQLVPIIALIVALLATGWLITSWSNAAIAAHRVAMTLMIAAGIAGVILHFRANMEFQLDIDSSLHGVALVSKVLQAKAPPALAPGSMALLGVIGLVGAFRLPRS